MPIITTKFDKKALLLREIIPLSDEISSPAAKLGWIDTDIKEMKSQSVSLFKGLQEKLVSK